MKQVHVYARSADAIVWLKANKEGLSETFKRVHRGPTTNHPHGLNFLVPPMTTEDSFEPSESSIYFYVSVSAHDDQSHLQTTANDIQRVFEQLGADTSQFTFKMIETETNPAERG